MNIFVASSKEGLYWAKKLKKQLEQSGKVTLWNQSFFQLNTAALDNLLQRGIQFDYAVILYTRDDQAVIRKKRYEMPRDNVIFEHGLFTGLLGKKRTFALVQEGTKLSSDLAGITQAFFQNEKEFLEQCRRVREEIEKESAVVRMSLLPSAASAVAYFDNFVKPVCQCLNQVPHVLCDGELVAFRTGICKLKIVLPNQIERDMTPLVQQLEQRRSLRRGEVLRASRSYPVLVQRNGDEAHIIDLPTGLSASYRVVSLYCGESAIGETEDFSRCMERELHNFKTTLSLLIKGDPLVRMMVVLVPWDV